MKKLKVIFFGTPDFSVPTLEMLYHHPRVEVLLVVSMPDRPFGRKQELKSPEVIQFAKENRIPTLQTENVNKEDVFKKMAKDTDLFIVLAFAQFLKQDLLDLPRLGCFNIHTSLLPKYRGAAPIQHAILNGDSSTGVSIQRMVLKMDAGDIVSEQEVSIHSEETGGSLYTKLKLQAALTLNDFIYNIQNSKLNSRKQNEAEVCFAPSLQREDGELNFKELTAKKIIDTIRAFHPWPGTYCMLDSKRLKVFSALTSNISLKPGEVKNQDGQLLVGCSDKTIRLVDIQFEGKKRSSDSIFLNGYRGDLKLI